MKKMSISSTRLMNRKLRVLLYTDILHYIQVVITLRAKKLLSVEAILTVKRAKTLNR